MMDAWRLYLFGAPRLERRGKQVAITRRRAMALLAYLSYTAQTHQRDILATLLWPESDQATALRYLRRELSLLRQALSGADKGPDNAAIILADRQQIGLDPGAELVLDVAQFQFALADVAAHGHFPEQPCAECLKDLTTAVTIYRGDFMAGFNLPDAPDFDEWQFFAREGLRQGLIEALQKLIEWHETRADYAEAIEYARRLLQIDPIMEAAHQKMMRLLAYNGQTGAALRQYQQCVRVLEEELALAPAAETTALYEATQAQELLPPATVLRKPVSGEKDDPPAPGDSPYKGMAYYDVADAHLFFGREQLTAKLAGTLQQWRFLAVVGASGSGKSSLVRAGLIAAFKAGQLPADDTALPRGSESWPVHLITPTAHPLKSLASSLTRKAESVRAVTVLMDDLARDRRSLGLFVQRQLARSEAGSLLLVVDQFEELFTLCHDEDKRRAFIENLLTAVSDDAAGPTRVVITLRADFYAHCAQYAGLRTALENHQVYIGQMNATELRRAIEGPAEAADWRFEAGLVDLLLHEVGADRDDLQEPGALPLLSHALLETWLHRRGRQLTFSSYAETGGVRRAIARTAEKVFHEELTPEQRPIARNIFLRLTELGEDTQDTRRRATIEELIPAPDKGLDVEKVIQTLVDARLVITSAGAAEVAHEALIREWPELRKWLDEDRAGLRLHRQLTDAAQEWLALDREEGALFRGARLAQASEWAEDRTADLNPLEVEFLEASRSLLRREEAEREAQRQRELEAARQLAQAESRRAEEQTRASGQLRRRAWFLAGTLLVVGVLAIAAVIFSQQASQNEREARSRVLAAAAVNHLEVDPELSILLALEGLSQAHTQEIEAALHRAVATSRVQHTLSGHSDEIWRVAISQDGKRLATAGLDGLVKVWDTDSGQELLTLAGHTDQVWDVDFSPDGKRLATASEDGTVKVWDADGGQLQRSFSGGMDWFDAVVFSPDGGMLAAAGAEEKVKIWVATTGQELQTLSGHTGVLWDVAFSPDGQRLVTAAGDQTAKVWDLGSGEELLSLSGHVEAVSSAVFSPDGALLATSSLDGTVRVWDAESGQLLYTLSGDNISIYRVAFSPDGDRLAAAFIDGKATMWQLSDEGGVHLLALAGHAGAVNDVTFSPDGARLVTAGLDGTARMWDVSSVAGRELLVVGEGRHDSFIRRVAISPNGRLLATAGMFDGTARVWDAESGEELLSLTDHGGAVWDVAFNPQSTHLATASADATARVWDTAAGALLLTLSGHETGRAAALPAGVTEVDFSPDGLHLATAGADGSVKVWDAESGDELFTIPAYAVAVKAVTFNPIGNQLATLSDDGIVKVWDITAAIDTAGDTPSRELLSLSGFPDPEVMFDLAISPEGKRLAVSGASLVRVWELSTDDDTNTLSGRELFDLAGITNIIFGLAFSPSGERLATASQDGTARLWDAHTGQPQLTLHGSGLGVSHVAFSPDGTRLLTANSDGTGRLYVMPVEELAALAQSRVTRSLTRDECQTFLHVEDCP